MRQAHIRLLTRADDCGGNATSNVAILQTCRHGIVRNVSLMAPGPAIEQAAALFAGEENVCFGLHATLNAEWDRVRFGPLCQRDEASSLVQEDGTFFQTTQALKENGVDPDDVVRELDAQLDRLRALGFDVSYADQHMGFGWIHPELPSVFDTWCDRRGLINADRLYRGLPQVDLPEGLDPVERVIARLSAAQPGQYVAIGHPAYDTDEMRELGHAGYPGEQVARERDWERRCFMDPRILHFFINYGVKPISFLQAEQTLETV